MSTCVGSGHCAGCCSPLFNERRAQILVELRR